MYPLASRARCGLSNRCKIAFITDNPRLLNSVQTELRSRSSKIACYMKHILQTIIAALVCIILVSCKKANYGRATLLEENQRSREEKEPLQPNEMLEKEALRFFINYPPGSADMVFKLFKASPNRSEIKLGIIQESREYYILSKYLDNNSDFILSVEYNTVLRDGAFQFSVDGISSLKGPAGLKLPDYLYTTESSGVKREFLKIRKGSLKFAFYPL